MTVALRFATLEQERGSRARWTSVTDTRAKVGRWIHAFRNDTRLNATIAFQSHFAYKALHPASTTEAP